MIKKIFREKFSFHEKNQEILNEKSLDTNNKGKFRITGSDHSEEEKSVFGSNQNTGSATIYNIDNTIYCLNINFATNFLDFKI